MLQKLASGNAHSAARSAQKCAQSSRIHHSCLPKHLRSQFMLSCALSHFTEFEATSQLPSPASAVPVDAQLCTEPRPATLLGIQTWGGKNNAVKCRGLLPVPGSWRPASELGGLRALDAFFSLSLSLLPLPLRPPSPSSLSSPLSLRQNDTSRQRQTQLARSTADTYFRSYNTGSAGQHCLAS